MNGSAKELKNMTGNPHLVDSNDTMCFNISTLIPGPNTTTPGENSTGGFTAPSALSKSEILVIVILSCIGVVGIFLNSGVLFTAIKGRLVKKDYRMVYYIFITVGDTLFSVHIVLNVINIAFRDAYIFRSFPVCLLVNTILGSMPYQWSALCILMLITDLVWTLRHPFTPDDNLRLFSKIGCVCTFFIGILVVIVPFLIWFDAPAQLPFCSIANLYGIHWDAYQLGAMIVISIYFILLAVVSVALVVVLYRTYTVPSYVKKSSVGPTVDQTGVPTVSGSVEHASRVSDDDSLGIAAEKRNHFLRACRTVASFMAVFLLCSGPYYVLMAMGLGCGRNCSFDTTAKRITRTIVSALVYLLPILDPILYTLRFELFRCSIKDVLARFCLIAGGQRVYGSSSFTEH